MDFFVRWGRKNPQLVSYFNSEEWEEFRGQTMRRYLIYIISLKYLLIYLILMMIYFKKQYAWNR